MATLPVQIVSSLKRTLPFLHYSHESFLFFEVPLNENFPEIEQKNTKTRQKFEEKYPHLIGLFEENTVGLIDKDEALEIAQRRFFNKQKKVLESSAIDESTFQNSLEISSRALAEYILYREIIIKKLARMGNESKEVDIHNLIVPRYKRFEGENFIDGLYSNNAWLLDDRFMSFRTILSESHMREVVNAITLKEDADAGDGRPDISMIFSASPKDRVHPSLARLTLITRH
jgi:hypothetical protein